MLRLRREAARAAATVRQLRRAGLAAIGEYLRGDAQAQQHALRALEQAEVGLRETHRDAFSLAALYRAIRIKQAAQQTTVKVARGPLDRRRDGLGAGRQAEAGGQTRQARDPKPVLVASGDRVPPGEVGARRERPGGLERGGHHGGNTASRHLAAGGHRCRPGRQHRATVGERPVADQQAEQVALAFRLPARPRRLAPMVVQQHAVTGGEFAGGAPLTLQRPACQPRHAADTVVIRQPQRVTLGGRELDDRLVGGLEESLRAGLVVTAVDARNERLTDQSATWRGPFAVCTQVSAVTHGLVARMFSHHQLLFISLTRSISTKPGSAKS